jgi:hypothetical protein
MTSDAIALLKADHKEGNRLFEVTVTSKSQETPDRPATPRKC